MDRLVTTAPALRGGARKGVREKVLQSETRFEVRPYRTVPMRGLPPALQSWQLQDLFQA